MAYRKDIQMLRGVAVLLVVLFHLGAPGFRNGFLGVDIFFVVSGYLMAMMYSPTDKIDFFRRRSMRLLPAYFATVAVTLIAAVFITTPNDYEQVVNQAIFATFFSSNIGYWLENSYFDKAAFKPLLHLWSLGVEIQFYLLVPAIYWIAQKSKSVFWVIAIASAGACFGLLGMSPKTSFFLLPFRLWEFMIGFGCAVYRTEQMRLLPWIGAAAFLFLFFATPFLEVDGYALNYVHGHPGLPALGVCLATAAVLSVGLPRAFKANPLAVLLEALGNYSYSVYLAHFPLIVLFLYRPFAGTLIGTTSIQQASALVCATAIVSALLFRLVELPLRRRRGALSLSALCAISIAIIAPAGAIFQKQSMPPAQLLIYQAWADRDGYRCPKLDRILHPFAISCEITNANPAPAHRILFVGNSHADSIKAAFAKAAQSRNSSVYFLVPNDPLMQGGASPEQVLNEAQKRKADTIVLHYSPGTIAAATIRQVTELSRQINVKVAFIMPVPIWQEPVPMALLKHTNGSAPLPGQSIEDYRRSNEALIRALMQFPPESVRVYDVASILCRPACELASPTGKPYYFDGGHLTLTGSAVLFGIFDQVLADLD